MKSAHTHTHTNTNTGSSKNEKPGVYGARESPVPEEAGAADEEEAFTETVRSPSLTALKRKSPAGVPVGQSDLTQAPAKRRRRV